MHEFYSSPLNIPLNSAGDYYHYYYDDSSSSYYQVYHYYVYSRHAFAPPEEGGAADGAAAGRPRAAERRGHPERGPQAPLEDAVAEGSPPE